MLHSHHHSFTDGLRNAEVGKKVPELLLIEALKQSLGHETAPHREHLRDLTGGDRHILTVETTQDRYLIIAIHLKNAKGAPVFVCHAVKL